MKTKEKIKLEKKQRRAARTRSNISGTAKIPRMSVYRSLNQISVQLIDDSKSKTIVSASSIKIDKKSKKEDIAKEVGKLIAKKAAEKNIKKVVFDKGSYKYHGRIKSLADGAREGGLEF